MLLKRDFDEKKQREVLETIHRQANSFKKIFDDYMDLERLDATKGKDFKFENTTLKPVFEQALSDPVISGRGDDVQLISPEHWPQVYVDPDRIKQAVMHLMYNAVNYSSVGSEIICRVKTETLNVGEQCTVEITDNGAGLTSDELNQVGARFYRTADSVSIPGGGLGLALAVRIMSIHKGVLQLQSSKGEGTTVTIRLPVIE